MRQFYIENIPKLFEEAGRESKAEFELANTFKVDHLGSVSYVAFPKKRQIVLKYCTGYQLGISSREILKDVLSIEDFLNEPIEILERAFKTLVKLIEGD